MVREFVYTSSNGTKSRKVFVIKENDSYIGGIDLNLLSEEDADTITKLYKDFDICEQLLHHIHGLYQDFVPTSDFKSNVVLEGFNSSWMKAYRQFIKRNIK